MRYTLMRAGNGRPLNSARRRMMLHPSGPDHVQQPFACRRTSRQIARFTASGMRYSLPLISRLGVVELGSAIGLVVSVRHAVGAAVVRIAAGHSLFRRQI